MTRSNIKEINKGEVFIAVNPNDIRNSQKNKSDANPKNQSAWSSVKARQSKGRELEIFAENLAASRCLILL